MDFFSVYREIWNFHKRFSVVKDDDRYWDAVIGESNRIAKKYSDARFVIDLLMAVVTELERRAKELRDKDAQAAGG